MNFTKPIARKKVTEKVQTAEGWRRLHAPAKVVKAKKTTKRAISTKKK